jgi:hypothetical protein
MQHQKREQGDLSPTTENHATPVAKSLDRPEDPKTKHESGLV